MKEIYLSYESGYMFKAYAIRYFRYKNNKYLIYTLNEKDEREYVKLYVVKVMKELDTFVTQTVRRPDEWQIMKGLVKRILGELKKGELKIITDLDLEEISEITIYENRHFLLASDLVNVLSSAPEEESIETLKTDKTSSKETEILKLEDEEILELEDEEILELEDEEIMELDDETEEVLDLQGSPTEEVLELNEEKKEVEVLDI